MAQTKTEYNLTSDDICVYRFSRSRAVVCCHRQSDKMNESETRYAVCVSEIKWGKAKKKKGWISYFLSHAFSFFPFVFVQVQLNYRIIEQERKFAKYFWLSFFFLPSVTLPLPLLVAYWLEFSVLKLSIRNIFVRVKIELSWMLSFSAFLSFFTVHHLTVNSFVRFHQIQRCENYCFARVEC